jgi:hypothetical protein
MMKKNHKLGIIIPYRNRYDHLLQFKLHIQRYLKSKDIKYELIIVEQDDEKPFNRGKLLNIGFKIAQERKCDYVVFHDVDMLPIDVDYSYSPDPLHLATSFTGDINRVVFDEYFGGVTLFPSDIFENINGYSNEYWGWGFEDDDLLYRCKTHMVNLDGKEIKMMGGNIAALKFNGYNAYIKGLNTINLYNPLTFFISFFPDDLICENNKYDDTYPIFSIPGYDLRISYNSYKRYNFEIYDCNKNVIYINSDIKPAYKTNIAVTIDPYAKIISMYQDGIKIGTTTYKSEFYHYQSETYFYIGVGNPNNLKNENYYRGLFDSFVIFSNILSENEIKEISNNQFFGLTQNFGEYKSSNHIQLYYDAKFIKGYRLIDLSEHNNNGEIVNCEIIGYTFENKKIIEVPYRRDSTFELLPHEENGYVGNGWKNITTRRNQLRFYNEVSKGYKDIKYDGLTTCEYIEHGRYKTNNITQIVVGI